MKEHIRRAHIFVLSGGFSSGDEPDGSAKFIVNVLNNKDIRDEIHALLDRGGLILGICNGFQALVKLGLVPFGDIRPMDADCATLTFNNIGRHQSTLVRTRVASTMSPWMSRMEVGEMHTVAISHGEGRFVAPQPLLDSMIANGQVATQYVDAAGQPSVDLAVNPNGSVLAIEGITSPDGHVLGKMGHTERAGAGPVQEHLRQHLPAPLRRRCRLLPHEVVTATRGSCRCMRWLLGRVACDRPSVGPGV